MKTTGINRTVANMSFVREDDWPQAPQRGHFSASRCRKAPQRGHFSASLMIAVSLIAALAIAGCGKGTSTSGGAGSPQGGYVGASGPASTASTVATIEQKLKADPKLAGANITVKEENGAVTLTGTVKSIEQKDRAEEVVIDEQKAQKVQIGMMDNLEVEEAGGAASAASEGGTNGGKTGAGGAGTTHGGK